MSVLFAGGEMSAFLPSDASVAEVTTAAYFDATYGRCAVQTSSSFGNSTSYMETDTLGAQTGTVWLHFSMWTGQPPTIGVTTYTAMTWLSAAGAEQFKVTYTGVGPGTDTMSVAMYYNLSGAWTQIGTSFTLTVNTRTDCDIKLKLGASGEAAFFAAGSSRASGTADLSGLTNIDKIRLYATYLPPKYSEVIVADESTIGWRLFCDEPTGNGSNTAWTGDYQDVDEITFSDVDRVYTASANDIETFTKARTLTGYDIIAVAVGARAKRGSTGPQNLQLALRVAGTNYFSATRALSEGYAPYVKVWNTNPATSAAWLAAAAAAEFGVKAIA